MVGPIYHQFLRYQNYGPELDNHAQEIFKGPFPLFVAVVLIEYKASSATYRPNQFSKFPSPDRNKSFTGMHTLVLMQCGSSIVL